MTTKTQLQNAINTVNSRYAKGLNDDDQVCKMIELDKSCKGFSFYPQFDNYILCTDYDKLKMYVNKYGYYSEEVEHFNSKLILKGGGTYKSDLNNKILAELKQTA
jgi:hypothetical protein